MLRTRVIPCLLLLNGGLVKTTKFSNPKYVGDPINAIRIFNEKEVDELVVLDISASKEGREPDYALIEEFAGECFMPLCYGGGIRTVGQASRLFNLGVEKLSLQTSVLDNPEIIQRIADSFGSQSVVASVDIKRSWRGEPLLYRAASGKTDRRPWIQHLESLVSAGTGEILLNAIDRDGTMKGMDIELIQQACRAVPVPVVAVGGVGSLEDIRMASTAGASGVGAGAFFVFHGPHRAVLITYPRYEDLESILSETV